MDALDGTLFVDEQKVADDVNIKSVKVSQNSDGTIAFLTEKSSEGGTLKKYNKDKTIQISEEVFNFELFDDGSIVFLRDYSSSSRKGELVINKNGKEEVIKEDVVDFIVQRNRDLYLGSSELLW